MKTTISARIMQLPLSLHVLDKIILQKSMVKGGAGSHDPGRTEWTWRRRGTKMTAMAIRIGERLSNMVGMIIIVPVLPQCPPRRKAARGLQENKIRRPQGGMVEMTMPFRMAASFLMA